MTFQRLGGRGLTTTGRFKSGQAGAGRARRLVLWVLGYAQNNLSFGLAVIKDQGLIGDVAQSYHVPWGA